MKPAWDALGDYYKGSSSVLIGDVDCTVHDKLCGKWGVQGYPTIKYYADGDKTGADYQGGRTEDALKEFASETLEIKCQVADQAKCSEKEVAFIAKMQKADGAEVKKQFDR